jgi:tripartite-type tricarboxylate transporter receptor subunit TctC
MKSVSFGVSWIAKAMTGSAAVLSALALSLSPASASSAAYPTKTVRLVVAFGAGGITDIIARALGQKLSERLGQTFVIDNRAGAGGALGAGLVSSAEPDGYTLLVTTAGIAIRAVAQDGAINPRTQLLPIAAPASTPSIWVVHSSVSLKEQNMMAYLRSRKDQSFTYGSPGVGTLEHLTSEYLFNAIPGIKSIHVPFQGGAAASTAVLGQQVDITTTAMPTAAALIRDGKLKVAAVGSTERMPQLPDAPTLSQAGFPDFESASWIAIFGPPKMPTDIAEKLNAAVNEVLGDAGLRERLTALGFTTHKRSQAETANYMQSELDRWRKVTTTIGFQIK